MPIGFIGIPMLTIIPSTASKNYCHGASPQSSLETQAGLPSQILKVNTACVRRLLMKSSRGCEDRFILLGVSSSARTLVVVHCYKEKRFRGQDYFCP
jgi:hypothetical protein